MYIIINTRNPQKPEIVYITNKNGKQIIMFFEDIETATIYANEKIGLYEIVKINQ